MIRHFRLLAFVPALLAYPAHAADVGPSNPFGAPPLGEGVLQKQAGREDVGQIAQSNSNATVTRNNIGDNARTGDATIDGAAFQNMTGLSMVNVNTGNNVAMNSSMNVNISITPAP